MTSGYDPTGEDEFELALGAEGIKSTAARGSFIIAGAQLLKAIMMLGTQIALARILLPSDFGLVAMVGPVISFAMILNNMGLAESLVQRAALDQNRVSSVFWGSTFISVLLALVMCLISPLIAWLYGNPSVLPLLLFASLSVPLSALGAVPTALLNRRMQFRRLQQAELASTAVGLVTTMAFAVSGFGFWSLPLGSILSAFISAVMVWIMCRWKPSRPTNWQVAIEDLGFGANLTGANISTYLTTTADNIIIGVMNGPKALGYYDRSYRLVVQPIGQLISPIGSIAVPLLSRLQSEPEQYRKTYFRLLRASMILTLPPAIVCCAYGDRIISILLGERWQPAAITFSWIAFGGVASALYSSLPWLFVSQDRTGTMRTAFFYSAVLNIFSFAGGAHWGVEGVAAGGALVFVFVTTPLVCFYATQHGLIKLGELGRCLAPYSIAVASALIVAFKIKSSLPDEPYRWIPQAALALTAAFMVPLSLSPIERGEFKLVISALLHRAKFTMSRFARTK